MKEHLYMRVKMRGFSMLRCVAIFVCALCVLWGARVQAAEVKASHAYVLAFTDFHGRLEEGKKDPGIAKFMGAVRAFTKEHPQTLLLAAGDIFTGTVESDLLKGKPTLEAMLAMNLAASAVGNHEFDWGTEDLPRWKKAGMVFLSANIRHKGQVPSGIEEGRIFTVGGMRVGVVGLTTTSTKRSTKQENVAHLDFMPPAVAAAPVVARLRKQGAEAVIVLAHLAGQERTGWKDGVAPAIREIARVPGVTAVVYGHSHEQHLSREGETVIVQPAYRGRSLAVIELIKSADGKVRASASIDALSERKEGLPVDAQGAAIFAKAQQDLGPAMQRVVAHAAHDIPHEDNRPSLLGQMLCQALLQETGEGQVAILNDGAIRSSLDRGPVTERNLYQIIPFGNRIMRMEMTGAELEKVLEFGLGEKQERSIQACGVTVRFNAAKPQGQRIVSMTLADGRAIEKDTPVQVLTLDFLAKGGDGFPFPQLGRRKNLTELQLRDLVRQWMEKEGTIKGALKPWVVAE